jgi:microcystin-dependent protein
LSRYKTFDSTGLATAGRLYAGDLNAIQDLYADLYNLAQAHGVASVALGEAGLQLLRYGAGEARLSGHLRTDGILRGLGGIYFGAFTTAQRNAIASGSRPFGLHIFNTDTGQLEYNAGTDASPSWIGLSPAGSQVPIGGTMDWPWDAISVPANYVLPYGQAISRTTYAALHALASAASYPWGNGDGSTTFNLPDYRGRVGVGKDNMGGTSVNRVTSGGSGVNGTQLGANGGAETVTLATGNLPAHNHGITGAPTLTGSVSNGTLGVGVGSLALPNHAHSISDPGHQHYTWADTTTSYLRAKIGVQTIGDDQGAVEQIGESSSANAPYQPLTTTGISVGNPTSLPAVTGSPNLTGSVSNGTLAATAGSLATSNTGSGTAVNNMPPTIIVNKIMRVA